MEPIKLKRWWCSNYGLEIDQPADFLGGVSMPRIAVFGIDFFAAVYTLYALVRSVVVVNNFFRVHIFFFLFAWFVVWKYKS